MASPGNVRAVNLEIALTNAYLRQVGVQLDPDDSPIVPSPGFIVKRLDSGVFSDRVAGAADNLINKATPDDMQKYLPKINDVQGDVQIIYTGRAAGRTDTTLGEAIFTAPNKSDTNGDFALEWRPSAGKIWTYQKMKIYNSPQAGNAWGLFVFDSNKETNVNIPNFAGTIAHEVGHILGLRHRGLQFRENYGPDGVVTPTFKGEIPALKPGGGYEPKDKNTNLMNYASNAQDLDLAQALAIQNSALFDNQAMGFKI